jgi:uncharacterized membrane protein
MESHLAQVLAAYLHVIGVAVYLGGSIVMEFVVGPAQKAIPPAQAQVMGQRTADRFLVLAWSALGLILLSGILRLFTMDAEDYLLGESLWDTEYGRTLLLMVTLWTVLVVNGSIITFVLRPKLTGRASAGMTPAQAQAHQKDQLRAAGRLTWFTRIDMGIALVVALLGSSLGFGGLESIF